tara:strand:- start:255 stop:560 length:306 start_codon:yes stop_codon:yes gene_type:complete
MSDISIEEYFKVGATLNKALGDDYDFKAYLEAIKKRNPNEELNLQEIKNAYKKIREKSDASEKALEKRGIQKKAKGGMVTKKKVAGRLAMRGYGKAMKGKK